MLNVKYPTFGSLKKLTLYTKSIFYTWTFKTFKKVSQPLATNKNVDKQKVKTLFVIIK